MTSDLPVFKGKLAIQQRLLPDYRAPFFDTLAGRCEGGLAILAGAPLAIESIPTGKHPQKARLTTTKNLNLFNPQHPLFICYQTDILDWMENEDPAALIIEANPRYLSNTAAIQWMKSHQRPVLGWGLGAPPLNGPLKAWRGWSRRRLFEKMDGLIAYSEKGARQYQEWMSAGGRRASSGPAKIFTAYNAVSAPPNGPAPSRPPPNDRPAKVLFVGRLQSRKNLHLLFKACAMLDINIQPDLTIVGDGPGAESFRNSAAREYPRTRFTGAMHGKDLEKEFLSADLFVLPGTGGLAVQEAMGYGLPVIVAQGDGTQEDLVSPKNGWLVEPGSIDSLQAALRMALKNPLSLREKGLESYRIVKEDVNIERMASTFIQALRECSQSP